MDLNDPMGRGLRYRLSATKFTSFMWYGKCQHTGSLRDRYEAGWTPALQKEYNDILGLCEREKRSYTEAEGERLMALSHLRCYHEPSEPTVFWSMNCCFWTDKSSELGAMNLSSDHGLPCCPSCGSPLLQGELTKFLESAYANPAHYGEAGLDNFWRSRGVGKCYKTFDEYDPLRLAEPDSHR